MTLRSRRSLFTITLLGLLATGFAAVVPAQAMAPTPVFAPYVNHEVGNAQAVAIGDFTGDDRNDVVVSTDEPDDDMSRPNRVYLFAQGPDGWMSRVQSLDTQNSWMPDLGLAAGDLDGDGKTDAVVANGHALDVFIQHDGSLTAGTPIALDGAQSVKAVDVDGDGKHDLVSSATMGLVALKGLGAGTFAPPVVITPQRQVEVEVGDVTGDGRRDLVTCSGTVALVFAQLAGGTFATPTEHAGDANCKSVALADVNGDGLTDVSIAGGGNVPSSRLNVFPQLSDGTVARTPATYATSDIPGSVKAGDMNTDGRADLVVVHDSWMWVGVHAQTPDHTLDPERLTRIPYNNGTSPHRMAIGDVNGDQRADIVMADDQHGLVTLWGQQAGPPTTTSTVRLPTTVATTPPPGAPRPLFSAPQSYDLAAAGESVVAGDFNGDGRTDVALSTRRRSDPSSSYKVFVFYQAADGSLPRAVSFDTEAGAGYGDIMVLAAGDLDGDGRTDLVLRMRDGINVFMQRNGTFADRTYTELPYANRVDLADLDGDGRADMVMTGLATTVYRSLGAGAFGSPVTVVSEYRSDMAIGDVTGDGRPDLVTISNFSSGAVEVYRQVPDGTFGAAERTSIGANPSEITLGDLTGDGKIDVAVSYEAGIQVVGLRVLVQGAGGTLTPGQDVAAYAAGPLRTGDVDGDGRTDLVAMYGSSAGVRLRQAGGQLGAEQLYPTSGPSNTPSSGVVLADFTGDRRPDIAAANFTTGLDVLRNTSTGVPPQLGGVIGSTFQPLTPHRVLDTRSGLGAPPVRLAPGGAVSLQVTGAGGVPAAGVSAVVMNVTVTDPSAPSFLTAWPAGSVRPLASNLNYVAGQTVPNLVVVKVGTEGKVDLFNSSGSTHVIADVAGWYGPDIGTPGGRYTPVTPVRILDTRAAAKVGPAGSLALQVAGQGGVPASGVSAVVLNVTATDPTATSYLTAWPAGEARPLASNLNYVAGQTVPNLVVVKVGAGGKVNLFNSSGSTHVIADVAGWFGTDGTSSVGLFTPVAPSRLLDTRSGDKVGPAGTFHLSVTGQGGVPASGVSAVVLNVTVTEPTATSFLTAFPAGEAKPLASNLNYVAGQTVPNLVVVKVGAGGAVDLFNSVGSGHVVADVAGWFN
ncbi:MAG TPA: VCBS repeat-containing protein [Acidimicrobiales bacterium]|nr:VCBS repeat-containing protein [Acidimicrobiales bacterium]